MTRFDHERIPERVVPARGSGAYGVFECTDGVFECTDALTDVTRGPLPPTSPGAHFLGEVDRQRSSASRSPAPSGSSLATTASLLGSDVGRPR
jgi:hypothetical protein